MWLRRFGSLLILGGALAAWTAFGLPAAPELARGQQPNPPAAAVPDSCPVHANRVAWPAENPIWVFCWTQPHETLKQVDGAGIRISHVYYKGKKVLEEGSLPCVNVKYRPDTACDSNGKCCGINLANNVHTYAYRDWMCQYAPFEADNVLIAPIVKVPDPDSVHTLRNGYAEPTRPAITLCDRHPNPGKDQGNFYGVALERRADRLVLTTALESGWYRYTQKWIFHRDGTIQPRIAFTAVDNACTSRPHHHNAYWRLDFDIVNGSNDVVEEVNDPPLSGGSQISTFAREVSRPNDPAHHRKWRVRDRTTGRGYEITAGPDDGVADDWGVADLWAVQYKGAHEHDDGGLRPNQMDGARAHISEFLNDEPIDGQDVVLWYHAGHMHTGGLTANCDPELIGPSLKPIGDW